MLPDEISAYLAGAGIGLSDGDNGNLFVVPFPDTAPEPAAFIMEVPGDDQLRTAGGSLAAQGMERPSFNVYVRGGVNGAAAARALAKAIFDKLNNLGPVTLAGVVYHDVKALYPPTGPTLDKNERPVYLLRFDVHKDPS